MRIDCCAERGTIDDVVMPHATRKRRADKFTQSAHEKSRALAMLRDKHVEWPVRKAMIGGFGL